MKITEAWATLGVVPKYPRSWSAWNEGRTTLYITLPEPDIQADGTSIDLWHELWRSKAGHTTATNTEQEQNLRDALAFNKPVMGFYVVMTPNGEHIKVAYPERLLPMSVRSEGAWRILGQAPEPIKVQST